MNSEIRLPRLAVVAAMIGNGGDVITVEKAPRLGNFRNAAASAATAQATPAEQALAEALQSEDEEGDDRPAEPVMAELLLLATGVGDTGELALGLSRAFESPSHTGPAVASAERAATFADVYRRLALHQLNSQVRNKAAAILARLKEH